MQFPASELVLNAKNRVYHLDIAPGELATDILLVGDQDRVALISAFFDEVEFRSKHREFVSATGTYRGKRISVLSTGIGTDNIDIVINELDALFNIDLEKREEKPEKTSLNLIRIGTCGILQPEIAVHSFLLSSYAFGLDNVAHFYETAFEKDELELAETLREHLDLPENIRPYAVKASEDLFRILSGEQTNPGITVTSSGFYGPQGRQLRLSNTTQNLNEKLGSFRGSNDLKVLNFEMESSALFALGKALGHSCITICLGVANRPKMEFSKGYNDSMTELAQYVLDRIVN